jgi:hypothetical protein
MHWISHEIACETYEAGKMQRLLAATAGSSSSVSSVLLQFLQFLHFFFFSSSGE